MVTGVAPDRRERLAGAIAAHGVDTRAALASGQLVFGEAADYQAADQESVVTAALADGFPGLRVSGFIDADLGGLTPEEYAAVEQRTDENCRRYPMSALCLWDPAAADRAPAAYARHLTAADRSGLVSTRHVDGAGILPAEVVADVVGEFDGSNAPMLRDLLARLTRAHRERHRVVVDLSGLRFLSAASGRAMLDGTAEFRDGGGTIVVRGAVTALVQVLTLLSLADGPGFELDGTGP